MPRNRPSGPHPIDVAVGARIRELRIRLGLSQGELGERMGVSFQQVQKYERGANRMGASRLHQVCEALDVSVWAILEGIFEKGDDAEKTGLSADASKVARDFDRIPDENAKTAIRAVVSGLAKS